MYQVTIFDDGGAPVRHGRFPATTHMIAIIAWIDRVAFNAGLDEPVMVSLSGHMYGYRRHGRKAGLTPVDEREPLPM